jgi:hypothetical protein
MKTFCKTTMIALFLLLLTGGIKAQTTQTKLDQLKLAQVFLGAWQQNAGKDTVQISETQQYGNLFVQNVSLIVQGKKSFSYIMNFGFSSKEDKFTGVVFYSSGFYQTWFASFTSEKIFSGDFVRNFNPETKTGKFEVKIETPTSMTMSMFNINGIKTGEYKNVKVK